ncbi:hypothetical protein M758_12G133600 [Ceratodon purpureus]|uniref:Late embryogenesis abundant protein LEA-2 subgroup domain-containing protein n=1 Tax=Ceratodon purpureus TaxID=3225 RepID=A0A8T0G994_CERPU|nr:hypothetical protein KC19_12G130600 [Ceratodon purpureus]KAG0599176.1 hypothetical protein M758_12G133600 [Ceratodon purpureus]KAG0599177.1 hypothetical protein M758_12G133600 [Ceratodon purpureus]
MGWNRLHRGEDIDGHPRGRHHRFRRCCIGMCTCILFIIVVLGLATLITWLVLRRPKATHYNIVSASVPTLAVVGDTSNLLTTSQVNAEFIYGLQAVNPNSRVGMEYDKFNVQTTYLGVDIGHTSIQGFRVGHSSSVTVTVTTLASGVVVNNIVGGGLKAQINRESVNVRVKIDTRARAHIGSYTSFWMWLHSECDLTVTPPSGSSPGTLITTNCENTG